MDSETICQCGKEKAFDEEKCPECQGAEQAEKSLNKIKENVMKDEIAVRQDTPAAMIEMAISKGADLEKLEKLLSLRERWEATEARKEFADSFANAQAEISLVIKNKVNPQTHSKYADLADIIESARPVYTNQGLSVSFYEGETTKQDHVRVCGDVSHRAGHKESYYLDVPIEITGIKGNQNMTKIHGKASAISYGRRYLMCMIWNISTGDDDDGNAAGAKSSNNGYIDDDQKHTIRDNLIDAGAKEYKFLLYMQVESIDKILKSQYQKALVAIEEQKKIIASKKKGNKQ